MAKQEVNSFDVRALVRELRHSLVGARVDRAFQPSREEILIRLRVPRVILEERAEASGHADEATSTTKRELVIGIGKWMALTTVSRKMPQQPSNFAMNLRKHLSGARLVAVRQFNFDRAVEMELEKKDGSYTLVVELFADGNVVLVKEGRIVLPLFHQSWAHREVRPGAEYVPPPERFNPLFAERDEFQERYRRSTTDAVRTLATELNLGGQYAEEVCARAGVPKNKPVSESTDEDVRALFDALAGLAEAIEWGDLNPVVAWKEDEKVDAAPFPLHAHEGLRLEEFPTLNAAFDAYFSKPATEVAEEDPRLKKVQEEKGRIDRMLSAQRAAVDKFSRESIESKELGDLLYANFNTVEAIRTKLIEAARDHGWKQVAEKLKGAKKAGHAKAVPVESVNPAEGTGVLRLPDVSGEERKVRVDLRKSVQDNAQDYYEKSKKMRDKLAGASRALELTEAKLRDVEARGVRMVEALEAEATRPEGTKRFWFEGYRWFVTSDGHLVLAGRDASTNDKLVKKHLEDNDRYVHADVHGAPSAVVKSTDGEVSEKALEEAAQFAASMSRIWQAGAAASEAYWVTPAQVSKTPNPGEYLAKGAFIIRGKRNYLRVQVRHAVGEVQYQGARKIMGGSPGAVTSRAERYVILEPGNESRNKLAGKLARAFHVPVEEVQAVMPPGDVRVIEARGVEVE